jgi:hypothetical protein
MGDAALHLDLFEQPGRERDIQHPAIDGNLAIRQSETQAAESLGRLIDELPSCQFFA